MRVWRVYMPAKQSTRIQDLHLLPKVKDSLSYLYVEHCVIDQEHKGIAINTADGRVPVPCAALAVLMLGPGTSISHAAILALADNGCLVVWCGEEGVRFYAQGMGETRSAARVLRQARLCCDPVLRLKVVRQMYAVRFPDPPDDALTIQQLRGREGVRVRDAYAAASVATGVPWHGRTYKRDEWGAADPVNRALSVANSCLYGLCHAAIVSAGYSPALGFIHTGKQLSFVYDIADLYKASITVPIAFHAVAEETEKLETRIRIACRDAFKATRLLARIVPDIARVLDVEGTSPLPANDEEQDRSSDIDADPALPGSLWDPDAGQVDGGQNYGDEEPPEGPVTHLDRYPDSPLPSDSLEDSDKDGGDSRPGSP